MKNIYIDVREYKGWAWHSWQKEENESWFVHFPDNDINNEKNDNNENNRESS